MVLRFVSVAVPPIDRGPHGPLSETGRAYFGGYLTGDVEANDFGDYTATGNVAATLNHDVAQHLIRLNRFVRLFLLCVRVSGLTMVVLLLMAVSPSSVLIRMTAMHS